jgi:hypothetical protein
MCTIKTGIKCLRWLKYGFWHINLLLLRYGLVYCRRSVDLTGFVSRPEVVWSENNSGSILLSFRRKWDPRSWHAPQAAGMFTKRHGHFEGWYLVCFATTSYRLSQRLHRCFQVILSCTFCSGTLFLSRSFCPRITSNWTFTSLVMKNLAVFVALGFSASHSRSTKPRSLRLVPHACERTTGVSSISSLSCSLSLSSTSFLDIILIEIVGSWLAATVVHTELSSGDPPLMLM